MPTIIPTPRARKIGSVMLVALVFHVILAALEFSALSIIDGMFDLIGAVVGYCAIRDSNRYNVYQVLCYCIYTGMDFFWGSVRIVLIATKATKIPGHKKWQYELYLVTVIGGTIFYLLACIISNMLYQELRKILQEINEPQAWTPGKINHSAEVQNHLIFSLNFKQHLHIHLDNFAFDTLFFAKITEISRSHSSSFSVFCTFFAFGFSFVHFVSVSAPKVANLSLCSKINKIL